MIIQKIKKYSKQILFALLILCACSLSVFAHSGGTDSKGGHYDHSTGEYHYHHGYSAHQHPNGICPYTSQTSKNKKNNSKENNFVVDIIGIGFAGLFISVITISSIRSYLTSKNNSRKKIISDVIDHYSEVELALKSVINDTVKFCNKILELKALVSSLPQGVSINSNNELHSYPNDIYTVYITPSKRTIHKVKGCSKANIPVNISEVYSKKRCKICFTATTKQITDNYSRDIIADVSSSWYREYICNIPRTEHNISWLQTAITNDTSTIKEKINAFNVYKQIYDKNRRKLIKHKNLYSLIQSADECNIDESYINKELHKWEMIRYSFSLSKTSIEKNLHSSKELPKSVKHEQIKIKED